MTSYGCILGWILCEWASSLGWFFSDFVQLHVQPKLHKYLVAGVCICSLHTWEFIQKIVYCSCTIHSRSKAPQQEIQLWLNTSANTLVKSRRMDSRWRIGRILVIGKFGGRCFIRLDYHSITFHVAICCFLLFTPTYNQRPAYYVPQRRQALLQSGHQRLKTTRGEGGLSKPKRSFRLQIT